MPVQEYAFTKSWWLNYHVKFPCTSMHLCLHDDNGEKYGSVRSAKCVEWYCLRGRALGEDVIQLLHLKLHDLHLHQDK